MIKKNDWFITLIAQPEMTMQDFANNDITPDNTGLLDKKQYKDNEKIQQFFQDKNGQFDEKKFNNVYDSALRMYNDFTISDFESRIEETFEYDQFDYFAPIDSKAKDNMPRLSTVINPKKVQTGVKTLFSESPSNFSFAEIAQTNKILNSSTGKFLDETPNDLGFFGTLFNKDTMVIAAYDEDVYDDKTGKLLHRKGEYKLLEDGTGYYETLNGRDIGNKTVLKTFDVLSEDGSAMNKYDFFDSDGLDKSTIGTIFKTAVTIAPMFIPGVGKVYGYLGAANELSKLVPTLMKSIAGVATNDNSGGFISTLNNIAGFGHRMGSSTSEASKDSMFTLENLGNLIIDSSMQLYQQRVIGEIPGLLKSKNMLAASKAGRNLSLAYMAGTSSMQAYDSFKEAGADDRTAGLGMLATMGAMYGLFSIDHFKNFLFKGTYLDDKVLRDVVKASSNEMMKKITTGAASVANKELSKNFFKKAYDLTFNKLSKIPSSSYIHAGAVEGVEETMEEIFSDGIKGMFKGLEALGVNMTKSEKDLDFKFTPKDMMSRYTMSFFGGAIGGPVFRAHTNWQNKLKGRSNQLLLDDPEGVTKEMVYLLRNGRKQEVLDELSRLHKKQVLGNVNLSAKKYDINDDQSITFHAASDNDNQNDAVYEQVVDYVNRIDGLMTHYGLMKSDKALTEEDLLGSAAHDEMVDRYLIQTGVSSRIYSDFQTLSENIIKTSAAMKNMEQVDAIDSERDKAVTERTEELKTNSEYQNLKTQLAELESNRDSILNGERKDYYYGQAIYVGSGFAPSLSSVGIRNYTRNILNKEYSDLSKSEKYYIDKKYEEYSKLEEREKAFQSYDLYINLQDSLTPDLLKYNDKFKSSNRQYGSSINLVLNETENLKDQYKDVQLQIKNGNTDPELLSKLTEIQDQIKTIKHSLYAIPVTDENTTIFQEDLDDRLWIDVVLNKYNDIKSKDGVVDKAEIAAAMQMDADLLFNKIKNDHSDDIFDEYDDKIRGIVVDYMSKVLKGGFKSDVILNTAIGEIEYIIGDHVDTSGIYAFLKEVEQKYSEALNVAASNGSPVYELLSKIKAYTTGSEDRTGFDIFTEEYDNFINSPNVDSYTIGNQDVISDLNDAIEYIKLAEAMIAGAREADSTSLNNSINRVRAENGKELLATISPNTADIMNDELYILKSKIGIMLKISEINSQSKLKIQEQINININSKLWEVTRNRDLIISLGQKLNIPESEMSELIPELNNEIVTKENYNELESKQIKYESKLHQIFNKHIEKQGLSPKEVVSMLKEELVSKDDKLFAQKPTKFTSTEKSLQPIDRMTYMISVLSYDSSEFYSKLKSVITDKFNKASILSQEYSARTGYIYSVNPALFNSLLDVVKESIPENDDNYNYLLSRENLYNSYSILGGTGTGKTSTILYVIQELHKIDDVNKQIFAVAPKDTQANNLSNELSIKEGNSFNIDEFVKTILTRSSKDISNLDVIDVNGVMVVDFNENDFDVKIDDLYKNSILIIDEITHMSFENMIVIKKWAKLNNVFIYTAGDFKQMRHTGVYNEVSPDKTKSKKKLAFGIEDFNMLTSPVLSASFRAGHSTKVHNYNVLNTLSESAVDVYYDNIEKSISDISMIVNDSVIINNLDLKFYEDDDVFYGEKIVDNSSDIKTYMDKLGNLSGKQAVIVDTDAKKSAYEAMYKNAKVINITTLTPDEIQGLEFDYTYIDINWNGEKWDILKAFYTLTQRSVNGSIIVNNRISNYLKLNSVLDNNSNYVISLSENQINDFQTWRLKGLENVSDSSKTIYAYEAFEQNEADLDQDSSDPDESTGTPDNQPNENHSSAPIPASVSTHLPTAPPVQSSGAPQPEPSALINDQQVSELPTNIPSEHQNNLRSVTVTMDPQRLFNSELVELEKNNVNSLMIGESLWGGNGWKGKLNEEQYLSVLATISCLYTFNHYKDSGKIRNLQQKYRWVNSYEISSPEFIVEEGILYASIKHINENKTLSIPLLKISGLPNGPIDITNFEYSPGRIQQVNQVRMSVSDIEKKFIHISTPSVVIDDKNRLASISNLANDTKDFIERNKGKAFIAATHDLLSTEKSIVVNKQDGEIVWLSQYGTQLVGVQQVFDSNSGGYPSMTYTQMSKLLKFTINELRKNEVDFNAFKNNIETTKNWMIVKVSESHVENKILKFEEFSQIENWEFGNDAIKVVWVKDGKYISVKPETVYQELMFDTKWENSKPILIKNPTREAIVNSFIAQYDVLYQDIKMDKNDNSGIVWAKPSGAVTNNQLSAMVPENVFTATMRLTISNNSQESENNSVSLYNEWLASAASEINTALDGISSNDVDKILKETEAYISAGSDVGVTNLALVNLQSIGQANPKFDHIQWMRLMNNHKITTSNTEATTVSETKTSNC